MASALARSFGATRRSRFGRVLAARIEEKAWLTPASHPSICTRGSARSELLCLQRRPFGMPRLVRSLSPSRFLRQNPLYTTTCASDLLAWHTAAHILRGS
jgi:hypothetical protein